MLEAILAEFGEGPNSLLDRPEVLRGLEYALDWCGAIVWRSPLMRARAAFSTKAGIQVGTSPRLVQESQNHGPQPSFTCFCRSLTEVSSRIRDVLLNLYDAGLGQTLAVKWDDLIEIDVEIQNRGKSTVKKILEEHILSHAKAYDSMAMGNMKGRRSALLFGPPGTSKTTLVRAFAAELKWPIVEIEPSGFLIDGIRCIQ